MKIDFNGREYDLRPTKIVAVARNYASHAKEMSAQVPSRPEIFLKPPSALIGHNGRVVIPTLSKRVDHEVELGVIVGRRCRKVMVEEALDYVLGYTVTVDITARDIQAEAKRRGMPWTVSKGFDTFSPTGPRIASKEEMDLGTGHEIWLKVNGDWRQRGSTGDMIFSVSELISYISGIMTLEEGDMIATGTPEGVGPLHHGDVVEAGVEGIGTLRFDVEDE